MRKYEKVIPPNPSRYYVKGDPKYKATYYPELTLIPSRNTSPSHTSAHTATNTTHPSPDNM